MLKVHKRLLCEGPEMPASNFPKEILTSSNISAPLVLRDPSEDWAGFCKCFPISSDYFFAHSMEQLLGHESIHDTSLI